MASDAEVTAMSHRILLLIKPSIELSMLCGSLTPHST